MAILVGGVLALVGLQFALWHLTRAAPDAEIDEYVRLVPQVGRAVLTFFEHEGSEHVRASVELAEETPRLELARRGKRPVLARWVGALPEQPLADAALAERFVCRVPESPRAFEVLARIKAALLASEERLPVSELKLDRSSLAIVLRADRKEIDSVTDLLAAVARAALAQGGVTVHGEDALRARCGYCHAEVADEPLATVACELCSTVVHELCWAEHGRCPVLGCKGAAPRRLAERGPQSR